MVLSNYLWFIIDPVVDELLCLLGMVPKVSPRLLLHYYCGWTLGCVSYGFCWIHTWERNIIDGYEFPKTWWCIACMDHNEIGLMSHEGDVLRIFDIASILSVHLFDIVVAP